MKFSFRTLFVVLVLLVPSLLVRLGTRPVYKIQEVRVAETAREMIASGDWLIPHYNGELRLQKPPLSYWLTALSYEIGGISEASTRIPAVLFGLLTAIALFGWTKRGADTKTAANTALVLVASYIGLRYFRSGEADAILLFFISLACVLGYDMLQRGGDTLRRALFGLALGLGFLSKGPAAFAVPLLSLLTFGVMEKRANQFKQCFSLLGVLLLLVAAFGWYAWIIWTLPDIAQHFMGKQVDETFISGTHAKAWWWYLAHMFEFFAPWGFLLIPAGWHAYTHREQLPGYVRFAWVWLAVVFVLLLLTINKQMQYALLFAPPIAVVIGHYLASAEQGFAKANRGLFYFFCLAAVAGVGYALHQSGASALAWFALPAASLALARWLQVEVSIPVLFVAGVTAMTYLYSSDRLSSEPRKAAAQEILAAASGRTPLYQAKPGDGALSFYAGHPVAPVGAEDIPQLLQHNSAVWFVTERTPAIADISTEVVAVSGEFKLCRLSRN